MSNPVAGVTTGTVASAVTPSVPPAPLASVNRYGAPFIALLLTAALATVVTLMNYSKSLVDGFTFLSIVVTAANV